MKTFLAVLLALATVTAQAETFVYKLKLTVTRTGAGTIKKTNFGGYFVGDGEGTLQFIAADTMRKRFHVYIPGDYTPANVFSAKGSLTFVKIEGSDEFSGVRIIGNNTGKSIADGSPIPKTLKISGSDVFGVAEDELWRVETYAGSLIYDALNTKKFFTQNIGFELAVLSLKGDLIAKGYSPE